MKFEEQESIDDSLEEVGAETENSSNEETKPMLDYDYIKSSEDIEVPPLLIDQVIGHEESIETIKKAAKQRRNVLLIGDPGVGKSMLAKGMAQILPHETLQDILVYPNIEDNNHPLIRTVPAGEGKKIVKVNRGSAKGHEERKTMITMFAIAAVVVIGFMYGRLLEGNIRITIRILPIINYTLCLNNRKFLPKNCKSESFALITTLTVNQTFVNL